MHFKNFTKAFSALKRGKFKLKFYSQIFSSIDERFFLKRLTAFNVQQQMSLSAILYWRKQNSCVLRGCVDVARFVLILVTDVAQEC